MSEPVWTPEEFERVFALPAEHPERRRAEASLEFQARLLMYGTFAALARDPAGAEARARAAAELAPRMARRLGLEIPAPPAAGEAAPAATPSVAVSPPPRAPGWLGAIAAWWLAPTRRAGLAFGVAMALAVAGWWTLGRTPATQVSRGTAPEAAVLTLDAQAAGPGRVTLSWNPIPEAQSYRLVFYGEHLEELARLDVAAGTRAELHSEALPAGLVRGAEVEVEVQAMAGGDPIARSKVRPLLLP